MQFLNIFAQASGVEGLTIGATKKTSIDTFGTRGYTKATHASQFDGSFKMQIDEVASVASSNQLTSEDFKVTFQRHTTPARCDKTIHFAMQER